MALFLKSRDGRLSVGSNPTSSEKIFKCLSLNKVSINLAVVCCNYEAI